MASASSGALVLWLYGPQPVEIQPVAQLLQLLERKKGLNVVAMQIVPGPNQIVKQLHPTGALKLLHGTDALGMIATQRHELVWDRGLRDEKPTDGTGVQRATEHLARLYAKDDVERLIEAGGNKNRAKAIDLATRHQLVTEVSGAVVLETVKQYKEAGLEPADEKDVPTVPEPGTWIVLLLGTTLLAKRRPRTCLKK